MKIYLNQLDVFAEAATRRFERKAVSHLSAIFPQAAERLGATGMAAIVHLGVLRAAEYGITRQCDVSRYIAVMLMLGRNFDRRLGRKIFREILNNPEARASARMSMLCDLVAKIIRVSAIHATEHISSSSNMHGE